MNTKATASAGVEVRTGTARYRTFVPFEAPHLMQRFPPPLAIQSRGTIKAVEEGNRLMLAFGVDGLAPVLVQEFKTLEVLMLGWTNQHALRHSIETGHAHFFSRARQCMWRKGERSGQALRIHRILVDDDQDSLVYQVEMTGGASCHVGYRSCFFRELQWLAPFTEGRLRFLETSKVFDPAVAYGHPTLKDTP